MSDTRMLQHTAEEIDRKLYLIDENKNLLPYPYTTNLADGLLPDGFENVGDGSILTYTPSGATVSSFSLNTCSLPVGKKYIASLDVTNILEEAVTNSGFSLNVEAYDNEQVLITTVDNIIKIDITNIVETPEIKDISIVVSLNVPTGFAAGLLIKPQIEEDTAETNGVPTNWVPYMDTVGKYVDERFNGTNAKIKVLADELDSTGCLIKGTGENSAQQKGTEAKALGDHSVAFNNSTAGMLGYRYKAIDLNNNKIYLTKKDIKNTDILFGDAVNGLSDDQISGLLAEETFITEYAKGDLFTLKTRGTDFDNITTIDLVENNVITYSVSFDAEGKETDPFAALTEAKVQTNDTYIDRYSFSVPTKPDKGYVVVSEEATAFGTPGTSALGRFSFAAGRDNLAVGDAATVFGRQNIAGYQAFVAGENSKGLNRNYTLARGSTNKATDTLLTGASNNTNSSGSYSLIAGYQNETNYPYTLIAGQANTSKSSHQAVFGMNANVYADMALVIGNGSETQKSNAFAVWKDGHVTLSKGPENDSDASTKKYVDTKDTEVKSYVDICIKGVNDKIDANAIPLKKGTQPTSLQQTGGTARATSIHTFAVVNGSATGNTSAAIGQGAAARFNYAIAIGTNSQANAQGSIVVGIGLSTAAPNTDENGNAKEGYENRELVVLGKFNKVVPGASASGRADGAALVVGNGSAYKKRKNGLVVWANGKVELGNTVNNTGDNINKGLIVQTDGRATVGKDPTEDMDVVPNHMLNELRDHVDDSITNIELTPGPQGIQGPRGIQGIQGIQGVQGEQGPKGDAAQFKISPVGDTTTYLYAGTATSGNPLDVYYNEHVKLDSTGQISAYSFNATSDARLKENFEPIITKKSILDLPTYKFDFIDGIKNQIGCKAQDLQEICPEIVVEDRDGYLSIQESKIIYLLLEEVKNLRARLDELEGR